MKDLPNTTTTKKVKFIGTENFINAQTGELIPMQVTEITERDFNFSKVWMRNFISTIELVGNQKTKIAFWIVDNLDKENKLIGTFRSISNATGISLKTVSETMRILQDADFIRKVSSGVYCVNPDIVFKGSKGSRLNALTTYKEIGFEPPELTKDEQIASIKQSIQALQIQLSKLESDETKTDGQLEIHGDNFVERYKS